MSTVNDHFRNLLDEIPGVHARDFLKAWNRETRNVCQKRRWRELREEIQFTIGTSSLLGTSSSALPYSTGTVGGTIGTNTITGSGTTWLGAWNGLNCVKLVIKGRNPAHIYDVIAVDNNAQTLTVFPALIDSYSGYQYDLVWQPGILLNLVPGRDIMGVRWLGRLDSTDRTETLMKQPEDYTLDRTALYSTTAHYYYIEMKDTGNVGTFVLHYYRWPKNITDMNTTIDLTNYVQDIIYATLLKQYVGRTPMDINVKQFVYADAKDRLDRSWRTGISADETLAKDLGVNQSTIWIPDRSSTGR